MKKVLKVLGLIMALIIIALGVTTGILFGRIFSVFHFDNGYVSFKLPAGWYAPKKSFNRAIIPLNHGLDVSIAGTSSLSIFMKNELPENPLDSRRPIWYPYRRATSEGGLVNIWNVPSPYKIVDYISPELNGIYTDKIIYYPYFLTALTPDMEVSIRLYVATGTPEASVRNMAAVILTTLRLKSGLQPFSAIPKLLKGNFIDVNTTKPNISASVLLFDKEKIQLPKNWIPSDLYLKHRIAGLSQSLLMRRWDAQSIFFEISETSVDRRYKGEWGPLLRVRYNRRDDSDRNYQKMNSRIERILNDIQVEKDTTRTSIIISQSPEIIFLKPLNKHNRTAQWICHSDKFTFMATGFLSVNKSPEELLVYEDVVKNIIRQLNK